MSIIQTLRDIEVAHGYWQDYQERTGKRAVSRR